MNSPITGQSLGGGGGSTLNGASAVETMISMLITLVAGFLVLATTSVVALLVMASGGFSAGGVMSAVSNAAPSAPQRGPCDPQPPGRQAMSAQYYVVVSLRLRLLVAGFFGFCVYETASAHAWGPMIVFLIPAGLASYAHAAPLGSEVGSRVLALIRLTVALLLLAACTTPAPSCKVGSLVPMNVGQWTPLPVDLRR